MKTRSLVILVAALGCLSVAVAYNASASFDGQNPPHAVDTAGKTIPESSATQPDKPIIFSKDGKDPIYLELKPEAAFDHTKHNTDLLHTLDGKTPTACVYCHHTEQPMPVADQPYLTKSERKEVLTAKLLEAPGAQAVNSCRHCHFQAEEGSPKKVKYPKGSEPQDAKGEAVLTNRVAYHVKCISCHMAATKRDAKLKGPQGCADCHVKKT